ncbi:MAG: hypothetical protein HY903_00355 [Deltaproteobacteria bacterium]|nr:hypothetical protein [Deltaproteobacteria bacterium]
MRRVLPALLFLAGPWSTVATTAVAAPPQSYERWLKPEPLSRDERALFRLARAWGAAHGQVLRYDSRLVRAARRLLSAVPTRAAQPIDLDEVRRTAQTLGFTDGQLAAIGLRLETPQALAAAINRQLQSAIGGLDVNRVGVASRTKDGETIALLLLSRHLVDLQPLPARVRPAALFHLGGRWRTPGTLQSATLAVELPGGAVERRPIEVSGKTFNLTLDLGSATGVARLEVLVDRGRGPEIAAIMPVGVDADPWAGKGTPDAPDPSAALRPDDELETALAALILGGREAAGVSLPAASAGLVDAARSHADEMRAGGFFAHVSPTTGDVTARLKRRGVRCVRTLENIAIGDSVESIWQQWMESPAHRANLLEPTVDALGVGVVSKPSAAGNSRLYAVAVLAKLADDGPGSELAALAMRQINDERSRRGMTPLTLDPQLSGLALRYSEGLARRAPVDDISPIRRALVDSVFEEAPVSEAAADVYLADSVAVAARSTHVRERFTRAGVGVHRDAGRNGPQLYVTVIYAND